MHVREKAYTSSEQGVTSIIKQRRFLPWAPAGGTFFMVQFVLEFEQESGRGNIVKRREEQFCIVLQLNDRHEQL